MRLPVSAMMMICVAGILFFLFIGFNHAFNSDNGLKNTLWASANKTMDGAQLQQYNNLMPQLTQGFGIACVMCFLIAIFIFVAEAFNRPPGDMQ